MSAVLSLSPVSAGIMALLNVSAFLALAPGGAWEDLPQREWPGDCLLFEVSEDRRNSGLGTKPGSGGSLIEVALRLHVYTQYGGMRTAQAAMGKAIELLNVPVTVEGYTFCGTEPFLDDVIPIGDELVAGVKVKELAANYRLYVEEV